MQYLSCYILSSIPMIEVRQYLPAFADGQRPQRAICATFDDVRRLEWVRRWEIFGLNNSAFFRWSLGDGDLLMAEFDEGRQWWVVAYLRGDRLDGQLPAWTPTA